MSMSLPVVGLDQDWRSGAACTGERADLWFAAGATEHKEAKRICRRCDVQGQCLRYALEAPVDYGIWGGLTERERRKLRRTKPQPPTTIKTTTTADWHPIAPAS